MALELPDARLLSRPARAGKVLKAEDFWAFGEARQTLEEAWRRRDEIIASAQDAYRAEQERGYRDGLERAKVEQSSRMLEVLGRAAEYYHRVESRMVEVVLDAVRHISATFDDRERVVMAVRHALQAVRTQKQLAVRVHPAQVDALRARMNELLLHFPAIEFVDVSGDARLGPDACVIDSEIGSVEASVAAQLEAMHETFRGVFGSALAVVEPVVPRPSADAAGPPDDPGAGA